MLHYGPTCRPVSRALICACVKVSLLECVFVLWVLCIESYSVSNYPWPSGRFYAFSPHPCGFFQNVLFLSFRLSPLPPVCLSPVKITLQSQASINWYHFFRETKERGLGIKRSLPRSRQDTGRETPGCLGEKCFLITLLPVNCLLPNQNPLLATTQCKLM